MRAHGAYGEAASRAWAVMLAWLDARGLTMRLPCGYGLAFDNPRRVASRECRYDACVELPNTFIQQATDGVGFQTLPGGAFARVRHVGPYDGIRQSVLAVRDVWLADQQPHLIVDRRRPFLFSYLDDPRTVAPDERRCDVCLPVRTPCEDVIPRVVFGETLPLV